MSKAEDTGASGQGAQGNKAIATHERMEPGKPTREMDEQAGSAGGAGAGAGADKDIEAIASQQGATQRGYTDDRKEKEDRPAQFDPAHPGGRPEGDPRR